MDFFSIILFLMLYYIRPHEWIDVIGAMKPMILTPLLALISLFTSHRGLGWNDLFKTPHDWMIAGCFLWTVGTGPDKWQAFSELIISYMFYWIAVLTLTTVKRLNSFLKWWALLIFILALFALASEYGFDPTDSGHLTHGRMKERLTLNVSIFNNPNALGHSVVPAVVMFYFIFFWKRPIFAKIFAPIAMLVPLYCLYLTVSKGAFLSCFATVINALTFRRPKAVQIAVLLTALTGGWLALNLLPRMSELDSSRHDEAIQGRVHAFRYGYRMLTTRLTGVGYAQFEKVLYAEEHFRKASHSTYIRCGAELGFPGFLLFFGVIYCCLRTIITANTGNDDEERIRRILFVLFVSYLVSSWMVDYWNRITFFLMAGATAAFHRYLLTHAHSATELSALNPEFRPHLRQSEPLTLAVSPALPTATTEGFAITSPLAPGEEPATSAKAFGIVWNRLTLFDLFMILAMTLAAVAFWSYIMNKM